MEKTNSGVVNLSNKDFHCCKSEVEFVKCDDGTIKSNAYFDISIGTRTIKLHSYNGDSKGYLKKMLLVKQALDYLMESHRKSVYEGAFRKFLNPLNSAMGGTVYVYYSSGFPAEITELNPKGIYTFFEVSDCVNKLRIFVGEGGVETFMQKMEVLSKEIDKHRKEIMKVCNRKIEKNKYI